MASRSGAWFAVIVLLTLGGTAAAAPNVSAAARSASRPRAEARIVRIGRPRTGIRTLGGGPRAPRLYDSRTHVSRIGEPRTGIRTLGGKPSARLYDSRTHVIRIGEPAPDVRRLGADMEPVRDRHERWLRSGGSGTMAHPEGRGPGAS